MLRIAVDCEEIPPEVLILVKELSQNSRRHVREVNTFLQPQSVRLTLNFKRCEQFISLCAKRNLLNDVVARARSPTVGLSELHVYHGY